MLWASVIAAIAHYLLRDIPLPDPVSILLKGAGVALLALWALQQEAGRDSRALALVLGLGALGDMAIEWSLQAGALCFFAGHITAIALYRRHRRPSLTPSQKGAVLALLLLTPVVSLLLTGEVQVGLYALALGGMAAAAWASRFSRYRVGIGAVLFVASDLLLFAGMGPLAGSMVPGLLVWPTYYAGQFLVATGVVRSLRGPAQSS